MEDWQKKFLQFKTQNQPSTTQQANNVKPSNTCSVREGAIMYRAVETQGFGSTAIIVVPAGSCPAEYSVRQFEYCHTPKTCYLLENQMSVIDMGKIHEKKTLNLVEVSSPFVGKFFVQQSNVVYGLNYSEDGSRAILRG